MRVRALKVDCVGPDKALANIKTYMRSLYDNISKVADSASIEPQSITGSSAVNGAAIDTQGYNTAVVRVRAAAASGSPTNANMAVKLQESATTTSGDFADALDNTGAVISQTVDAAAAAKGVDLRVEGLGNLNRKRYLRVIITPSFVGGTTPAVVCFGEIVMSRAYNKPVNTTTSNT